LRPIRGLGKDEIPAVITALKKTECRLWEIAENVHRAELTVQERADLIEEWVELVKRRKGAQLAHPGGKQQTDQGIKAASRELVLDRRDVQRAMRIASIAPEAKEIARDAGMADNQSKLLEIAREPTAKLQIEKAEELTKPKKPEPSAFQGLHELKQEITVFSCRLSRQLDHLARIDSVPDEVRISIYQGLELLRERVASYIDRFEIKPPFVEDVPGATALPPAEMVKAIAGRVEAESNSNPQTK
jgi:ParB-like chromosome segregation protein Spo0J